MRLVDAERGQQRGAVPGVVGVGTHPAISGRPQPGQRGEALAPAPGRIAQPCLAAYRGRDVPGVHDDFGTAAAAYLGQVGGRVEAGGHRADRTVGHGQRRGQRRRPRIPAHLHHQPIIPPPKGDPRFPAGCIPSMFPGMFDVWWTR